MDLFAWNSKNSIIKGVDKKNPDIWIFVLLISQLLYIESLKFLYLPHIIRGVLCGVDTGILKIRCKEAEIWAKQKFKCQVYLSTPFSLFESSFLKIHWFWRFGIKIKKTGTTPGVKGFFFIFLFSLGLSWTLKLVSTTHHPPGTFQMEGKVLGIPNLVCKH